LSTLLVKICVAGKA
jgi:thiol-disulfide isomerase/thioredoxin